VAGKSSGSKFASAFKGFVAAAGLSKFLSSAIFSGADLQQSLGGVETMFKDHADIVKANAREAYKSAGLSANEYMEAVTGFSASLLQSLGGDTLKASGMADMALRDMSDNANKFGSDMEGIKNTYQGLAKQNYTMLDNLKLGYGGTKKEMERLLKDAQAISGVEYDVTSFADMVDAIHVIQNEMGVTGTTAKEASSTISGSLASMKASFSNVLADLSLGNDLKPSLKALTDTVVVFGKNNLLPMLKNILSALPVMLTTLIVGLGPEIAPAALEIISALCDGLITNLPTLIPGVVGIALGIVDLLTSPDTIGQLLNAAVGIILALADGLIQSLPLLIERVPLILENILLSLSSGYDILVSGAMQLFEGITAAIPIFLPRLTAAIPLIVETVTSFLINNLPLLISSAITMFTGLLTAIPTIAAELSRHLPQIILTITQTLVNAAPQILSAAVQALLSIARAVPQVLNSLFSSMTELGRNLISGLWQGISNSYTWIRNKISGWVGDVLSFLKNLFGIHSPSTKTAYQGRMLGKGLAKGILDSEPEVFKAVRGITKMTTGTFETGLSVRAVGTLASHDFVASAPAAQTWTDVSSEIRALGDRIEHMQVSLDGKKVVGGIVTDMRHELGLQEELAKRGVIK